MLNQILVIPLLPNTKNSFSPSKVIILISRIKPTCVFTTLYFYICLKSGLRNKATTCPFGWPQMMILLLTCKILEHYACVLSGATKVKVERFKIPKYSLCYIHIKSPRMLHCCSGMCPLRWSGFLSSLRVWISRKWMTDMSSFSSEVEKPAINILLFFEYSYTCMKAKVYFSSIKYAFLGLRWVLKGNRYEASRLSLISKSSEDF